MGGGMDHGVMSGEEEESEREEEEEYVEGAAGGIETESGKLRECVRDGGRKSCERERGDESDGRAQRGGGGEGGNMGRVIYPTPIEIVGVSGNLCHIYDADGLEFNGISVDGLAREPEVVTQARSRCTSTSAGITQGMEDDIKADTNLPPGGH